MFFSFWLPIYTHTIHLKKNCKFYPLGFWEPWAQRLLAKPFETGQTVGYDSFSSFFSAPNKMRRSMFMEVLQSCISRYNRTKKDLTRHNRLRFHPARNAHVSCVVGLPWRTRALLLSRNCPHCECSKEQASRHARQTHGVFYLVCYFFCHFSVQNATCSGANKADGAF